MAAQRLLRLRPLVALSSAIVTTSASSSIITEPNMSAHKVTITEPAVKSASPDAKELKAHHVGTPSAPRYENPWPSWKLLATPRTVMSHML